MTCVEISPIIPSESEAVTLAGNIDTTSRGQVNGGKITEVTLNDTTWTALPPTPLDPRNVIAVQNGSGQTIKTNWNGSQAGFVGMVVASGFERQYEVAETVLLYAKCETGTAVVTVEELG